MLALFLIIHIFIGSTLAGSAVIAALSMGFDDARAIILAAVLGFVVSLPASWGVAKWLVSNQS